MLNFEQALDNMPHTGRMRLIQAILSADDLSIRCRGIDHRPENYPLRVKNRLYTLTLCEVGAQAAAAHASLFRMRDQHTGLLVAMRNVIVKRDDLEADDAGLTASARQLHFDANGAIYDFAVTGSLGEILSGQAVLRMEGDSL